MHVAPTVVDEPVVVRLTPAGTTCRVDFAVSPTRVPATYEHGATDTRRLGLHFTPFVYTPSG